MKKILCLFLSLALLCLCGCAASQPGESQGNSDPSGAQLSSPFTDEFFANVVEIGEVHTGKISGEQMAPVIAYLKSLELEPTDTYLSSYDENGNMLVGGPSAITFKMNDGTSLGFLYSGVYLTKGDGSCSYKLVEGNLNEGLEEAFDQAMNGGDG